MITEYTNYCIICGAPKTDDHHLVFGRGRRALAEKDDLICPLCRKHHEAIHKGDMQTLSKIIGQLAYERNKCADGMSIEDAREAFRTRYSESYL